MTEKPTYEALERRVQELESANRDLHRSIKTLQESEEIFNAFMENSPIYVFFKDEEIRSIRLSRNYEQMLDRPLDDILGRTMDELFPSELAQNIITDDKKILKEGQLVTVDEEFKGRYYITTKFPIILGENNYLAGISQDITERREAEDSLRHSEELLRSIYRAAPTGIGVVSNRVLTSVNDRVCAMTGYGREELLGRNARMLYPSDRDYAFVGDEKYRQISEYGSGNVETRWQHKDGKVFDVLMSSTPINPEDLSAGVTFTALDITERKKTERELRRSHKMFLTVLEGIDAGVCVVDMSSHEILYINKHMIDEWGSDFAGGLCHEAFRGETAPCSDCINEHLLDENSRPTGVHIRETMNARTKRRYVNHDRAVQWLDGRMVKLQITFDVTAIKEMEEEQNRITKQLMQVQKMESVGRLAGGIAHDFNNMLGAILGYTELGMSDLSPENPIYEILKEIQEAVQRSTNLTRQLLTFARKETVTPQVLDLNDVVEGMLKMLRQMIGEDINLIWRPGKGLNPIRMDPSQIEQLLANLCINARDAIRDTGEIAVMTQNVTFDQTDRSEQLGATPGEYVMLAVGDNGCGMDTDTLSHVFEPFFTTKEVGKGTGLGLSTVYGMVKQNKGFINVESKPGKGTDFNIYLPRDASGHHQPISKAEGIEQAARGHETILLVEDNPMILETAAKMLKHQGYSLITAAKPSEAIRKAQEHAGEIHLLLTDVVMPEMNGRDLAKHLLSLFPDIKRLFMSGYSTDIIANRGVMADGIHFIQKPFSIQSLAAKVRDVLDDTHPAAGP